MQAVFSFRQNLPVDFHIVGRFKSRVFVRARAPNFAVWHEFAEDFAVFNVRTMINDGRFLRRR